MDARRAAAGLAVVEVESEVAELPAALALAAAGVLGDPLRRGREFHRRSWLLSALRACTKAQYKPDLL